MIAALGLVLVAGTALATPATSGANAAGVLSASVPAAAVPAAAVPTVAANPAVDQPGCRALPAPARSALRADQATETFGVDGTSVTVGIISGSFGTSGQAAVDADVAAGLLPGAGNPCGRTQPVRVLIEGSDDDEGRAMAQAVHSVAPGASIVFASGGGGDAGVATAIDALVAAGATVIVDDVQADDERPYQRGAAGAAIQRAVYAGVLYVTAASNYGVSGAAGYPSAGYPIGGWSTAAYRAGPCAADVAALYAPESVDCLDFDPGAAVDPELEFTLPAHGAMAASLNWADPIGAVTTQLDYVLRTAGTLNRVPAGDPTIPRVKAGVFSTADTVVTQGVSIVRHLPAPAAAPPVSLILTGIPGESAILHQDRFESTGPDVVGSTLFGHQSDPAALAVAAVDSGTLTLETFSTLGPATTFFGAGITEPVTVPGPAVAGTDDLPVSTTVLTGNVIFKGTSAAAPTVAAVAALARELAPDATPADLRAALTEGARTDGVQTPWNAAIPASRYWGAGLVDAAATLEFLAPTPAPTPTPTPGPTASPEPAAPAADSGLPSRAAAELPATGASSDGALTVAVAALLLGAGLVALRRRRA